MATEKVKGGNEEPEERANLSATAMFLRGFESSPGASGGPGNAPGAAQAFDVRELTASPSVVPPSLAPAEVRDEPRVEGRGPAASAPGEFTGLFQAASSPSSASSSGTEAAKPTPSAPAAPAGVPSAPGEFTRIFVGAQTPSASTPAPKFDEVPHPVTAQPPVGSRSKGFSSPGLSDSASGEGGFTQFFQSPMERPGDRPRPSAPTPTAAPPLAPPPAPSQPIASGRQELASLPMTGSAVSSPSVTSLLSSLSSAPSTSAAPARPEPEPFRPAPAPSWHSPSARPAEPPLEPGGVTKLIQRLGHEPATVPAPPISAAPAAAPVDSGPGEFTRMISTLGVSGASPSAPSSSAPPAAQPAATLGGPAAPPVQAPIQVPVKVAVQVPAIPAQAPTPPAGAGPVAAPKAPPIAVPVPPAPKLAPALPLAVAKGKFDAIVPLLLIVNTFLLLAILLVLLFQPRGH